MNRKKKKKAGLTIHIPDNVDFKTKAIKGGKGHFIILKGRMP